MIIFGQEDYKIIADSICDFVMAMRSNMARGMKGVGRAAYLDALKTGASDFEFFKEYKPQGARSIIARPSENYCFLNACQQRNWNHFRYTYRR